MLKIHFTAADLARVRLATRPSPLLESGFSLELVLRGKGGDAFRPWRELVWARIPTPLPMLRHLIGGRGLWPAFLGPTTTDLATAWDEVRGTAPHRLRSVVTTLDRRSRLPGWARALADGEADALDHLMGEYRTYHAAAIAPVWPSVVHAQRADLHIRTAVLASSGVERLLGTLHPALSWQESTLVCHLPDGPHGDVHLDGRGLRLAPSVFARTPDYVDIDGVPTILYPAGLESGPPLWPGDWGAGADLAALIGRTRQGVLRAVATHGPISTSELAHALDISLAAASKHTSVLRANRLIISHRAEYRVLHLVTALGEELLNHA